MRRQTRWDHRPPDTVDPPDDWVNGSWTVDCVCGVNFDDGEEMVNCDECGVWVHTRCSRYVKSEKLFACDKCKSNKNNKDYDNNDRIEEEEAETEVAQLLIDLPSKALRRSLGNPIPSHGFRRRPMEERVHVQGIPGGDVGIFGGAGLSSVFGPELWKCTGYVPKKFNFQYNEFGCWNDGNENRANVGDVNAEVLSLSKNKAVVDVDSASLGAGTETQVQETKKKGEGDDLDVRSMQHNRIKKKDRSSVHQTMIHYGKRKKEDSETTKDVSGKKKARVVHVEGEDSKKRSPRTSRSAATPSGDSKQPEFHGSGGFKVDENVTESGKNKKLKGNLRDEPSLKVDDPKNTLAFSGQTPKTSSCVASTHKISVQAGPEDGCDEITASLQNSSKISDSLRLLRDHNESGSLPAKAEDVVSFDNVNHRGVVSISDQVKTDHPVQSAETVAPQVIDSQNDRDSTGPSSLPQHHDHVITKVECADSLQSIDHKVEDADREIDNAEGAPSAPVLFQFNSQLFGSDSSQMAMERSSALKQVTQGEEPSESCDTTLISSEQLSQRKLMVSFGKSSSTTLLSKCLTSDSRRSLDSQNFNGSIKHNVVSEHKSSKKDNSSAGFVMDRERYGKPKKVAKELRKSSISSVKTSNLSKIPVSSISTKSLSETKESTGISSVKRSLVQNVSDNPMSGESASLLQPENITCVDNKATTSGLMQRTEPVNHVTSSKVNHTPQMHHSTASNTPATLSDEELALLLHHELNSSPRVPRLPRMRHAGSLPQLASPTGATMLTKRSSSGSVGKDQGLVFKRKGKSIANEGTKNSHKLQDEYKNVKKSPLLPVQRTNDSTRTADSVTKKEVDYGSAAGVKSVNKSILRATTLTGGSASSAAIDAREQNVSSTCKSPHNASDDDTGTDARPIHRTLPELLSEIMNKRMTYEELCNAVLPHWPYLRKHNGERYAYSSHSQAVLDCLRNRSEWARLVDRGPKTNAGRKRRRSDAEAPSFESEGNDGNTKNAKGVVRKNIESQKDQFPKGKRKARKCRRRLSPQGTGLKNMVLRRGRKQKEADDVSYDEDICSLSSSSSGEESTSDEDSGGTSSASGQSEASASSE